MQVRKVSEQALPTLSASEMWNRLIFDKFSRMLLLLISGQRLREQHQQFMVFRRGGVLTAAGLPSPFLS